WRKPPRDEGISCVIRCLDEAEWIRLGILSILDFADEIIVVDCGSTDGSLELVRRLKEDAGIAKLHLHTGPAVDGVKVTLADLNNYAFGLATRSWIFKWDADFIARTDQAYSILELKELWGRTRDRLDVFRLEGPNLWGDHRHCWYRPDKGRDFCSENYLWRNRGWKVRQGSRNEKLKLRAHRRRLRIGPMADPAERRVFFYHMMALKPDRRVAHRNMLFEWFAYCGRRRRPELTMEEWRARRWGTGDPEEQRRRCLAELLASPNLRPFDKVGGGWGDYPTLLRPYLQNPRYEIVYRDGKPHHRVTHADRPIPLPALA
ncbi:MAG: glycosyltransferase, partial [Planctomycetota bacterium]